MQIAPHTDSGFCRAGAAGFWHACAASLLLLTTSTLLTTPSNADAQSGNSDIWICVDAQSGAKTFTSNPRGLSNCRRADLPGITRAARPATAQANGAAGAASASGARPVARSAAPAQVASAEQRQRESDRKQILQDELASENKKYAELQHELSLGPQRLPSETDENKYRDRKQRLSQDIERSRVNIRSLERELERL